MLVGYFWKVQKGSLRRWRFEENSFKAISSQASKLVQLNPLSHPEVEGCLEIEASRLRSSEFGRVAVGATAKRPNLEGKTSAAKRAPCVFSMELHWKV